ncbi:MAG: hypothetical protein R2753_17875 [Chitinophagales bacterium]
MGTKDFLLAPFILMIIYALAFFIRNRYIDKDDPTRSYFIIGLNLKVIGAFATAMIYWYYYGTGDTIWYYKYVSGWRDFISQDSTTGLKLFFHGYYDNDFFVQRNLWRIRSWDKSYMVVVKIATFVSFFVFRTYIGIAIVFSFISYLGIWLLYRVFYHLYPSLYKQLAYAILFVPSVVFWGSGLFKDTITIGCVGWAVYSVYRVFINPKRRFVNGFLLVLNIYMIILIKTYIIACLVPMILAWLVLTYRSNIKSKYVKFAMTPILIVATLIGGFVMTRQLSAMSDTFSFDQLEKRAEDMVWWHDKVKELYGEDGGGGSNYTLGNPYDFSPTGILKKIPAAINVTLFRPYLWEAGNPVMLFSALESFAIFLLFMVLLMRLKLKLLPKMFGEPFLVLCFGFSLLFSVGVGITSANFGALVRYKIPAMPFFIGGLVIVYYKHKWSKEEKKKLKEQVVMERSNLELDT